MRWIGQVVQQNLDPGVRKRFPNKAHDPLIVFEELLRVVGNRLAVIFLEQLRVNLLLSGFELRPHVVLLADKNELPRCRMILILEEVMRAQPEVFQTEFTKVLARDHERVEIVLFEISAKLATAFLVFSPEKARGQKEQ